jgi:dihydroflavonol-4-reductase
VSKGIVLVTGATGFVGSHLTRRLLARGEAVRVLVRRESKPDNLEGLAVERVVGDLTDPASLAKAVAGCRAVFHAAADYRLWAPNPWVLYETNVRGTRGLLRASLAAKVGRVVYTSTVGALGIPANGRPGNEETPAALADMVGHYKRSKFLAEAEARQAAREGLEVVIVNPSTPVGSRDIKPTPTGQMIVDFLKGRMPAYVDTGLNLVDVEDVAEGHLLAWERGRPGQRYILGHQNLAMKEILDLLSRISGVPSPRWRLPWAAALGLAVVSTGVSRLTGKPPRVPLEAVRMAGKTMFFDSSKAVRELGLPQTPVEEALRKAVDWFRAHGYVRNGGRG